MSELVAALLLWIAGEMGLAAPPPPSIELLAKAQISERLYGRSWREHDDIRALYDGAVQTVYLIDDWHAADTGNRAVLLHELVHHVQAFHRIASQCAGNRERQAYELTVKWLREQGVADPYRVMGTDEYTILALSTCADWGLSHRVSQGRNRG